MPEFKLPGAKDFSRYLSELGEGSLEARGPHMTERAIQQWDVHYAGEKIGVYIVNQCVASLPTHPDREFHSIAYIGKIPSGRKIRTDATQSDYFLSHPLSDGAPCLEFWLFYSPDKGRLDRNADIQFP